MTLKVEFPKYVILLFLTLNLFNYNAFSQDSNIPYKTEQGLYKIETNGLVMTIDPNMAGRIISFSIQGKEVLKDPTAQRLHYGSTFWSSPQNVWNWPPRKAHDTDPFEAKISGNQLILSGAYDSLTGFRIIKTFQANPSDESVAIKYTLQNLSKEKKKVAPWEVTRVSTGGLSFFPKQSEPASHSTLKVKDVSGVFWYSSDLEHTKERDSKLFANGAEGWLAHIHNGLLFIKEFPDISPGTSPEKEEEVEIYVNPAFKYIELENQGAYTLLNPGESLDYEVKWYLKTLPADLQVVEGNTKLVDFVRNAIK